MKQDTCGHQWIISLTQQEQESDLDAKLIQIFNELLGLNGFTIYVNKYFNQGLAPRIINPQTNNKHLTEGEAFRVLNQLNTDESAVKCTIAIKHLCEVIGFVMINPAITLLEQTQLLIFNLLKVYANQLGLLYRSCLDPLTEMLNRQTFDKKVLEIVSGKGFLMTRNKQPQQRFWFLAIIDIDHFKSVNDTYGHVIGDEVILLVARLLKKNFRLEDYVFRYGGEEFAVLFQAHNKDDADNSLNRLREKISHFNFPQIGQLTVSSGFLQLKSVDSVASLVNKADVALYHSKHNGRNRVTAYSDLNLVEEVMVDNGIELF